MDGSTHYEKGERPWGIFERFTLNEPSTVKIISVDADQKLSLQTHARREEFWHFISGSAEVTVGKDIRSAHPGDNFFIQKDTAHRVEAGPEGCTFLEVAYGEFDEQDIIRLEDEYGRA
jgi:mannose-6-phosphate isomerase-like protein (cupin superfamily)